MSGCTWPYAPVLMGICSPTMGAAAAKPSGITERTMTNAIRIASAFRLLMQLPLCLGPNDVGQSTTVSLTA